VHFVIHTDSTPHGWAASHDPHSRGVGALIDTLQGAVEAQLQEGLHGGAGAIGVLPSSADDILGPRVRRMAGGAAAFFLGVL